MGLFGAVGENLIICSPTFLNDVGLGLHITIWWRDFVFHPHYRIFEIEKELTDAAAENQPSFHLSDDPH